MIRHARSLVAACLVLTGSSAASAATIAVPLPPLANDTASGTIFDALLAISRTSVIDPRRAEQGVAPYTLAIQAYRTGDSAGAQAAAVKTLVALDVPYAPHTTSNSPVVSPPAPAQYPPLVSVSEGESEERLGLARRALFNCGAPTATAYTTARPIFDDAVQNVLAHRPDAVNADVAQIVDGCAAAIPTATDTQPPH